MAFSASYDNPSAPGTGAAVSNREDLTNILVQLDPVSTPLVSLLRRTKARATSHEWTVDGLAAVDTSGILEGADTTSFSDKFEGRARLSNVVQGFRRDYQVSQVQQAVDGVGPAGKSAAQVKCLRELKRDLEAAVYSANDRTTGSGSAAAVMRGFNDWLDSSGPSDVPTAYRTPADQVITMSNAAVTEAKLSAALASMFNVSGNLNNVTLVADTTVRDSIANFMRAAHSGTATRYSVNGTGKTVTLSVSLYDSDFGSIKIANSNPDCSPDTTNHDRALAVNLDHASLATLIPAKQVSLEDQGGGARGYCETWATLACHDPRAHASIDEVRS